MSLNRNHQAFAGYQGTEKSEALRKLDVDRVIAERPGKVRTLVYCLLLIGR